MRLLLDESLPSRLRHSLTGHVVKTVVEMGWGGTRNGKLLALASEQFDTFLTADNNLPYQQNVAKLPIAVVVLAAHSNELPHHRQSLQGAGGAAGGAAVSYLSLPSQKRSTTLTSVVAKQA